jgi:hypothetical protein
MNDRGLGDVVPPDPRFWTESSDRGNVQHDSPVLLHPLVPRRRGVGDDGGLIDLVGLLHQRVTDVDEGAEVGIRPGVVDEDIERSEVRNRLVHQVIGTRA